MAQYIDKDKLLMELTRRLESYKEEISKFTSKYLIADIIAKEEECKELISFLDNLEVKEVDLEKVIQEYFKGWEVNKDLGLVKPDGWSCIVKDLYNVAKYFYKLGLAQKGE